MCPLYFSAYDGCVDFADNDSICNCGKLYKKKDENALLPQFVKALEITAPYKNSNYRKKMLLKFHHEIIQNTLFSYLFVAKI